MQNEPEQVGTGMLGVDDQHEEREANESGADPGIRGSQNGNRI